MEKGLAERISARLQELGKKPIPAAMEVGLERTYLRDLITGRKKSIGSRYYGQVAAALGWTVPQLLGVELAYDQRVTIRPAGPEPTEVEKVGEGWPDVGDEWMDVRGVAVGGSDGSFYFEDVVDRVRRPPGIRKAKNVAALNAIGESMAPRFRPGELVYVQLREPVPGDDVVVELYPEKEGDPPKAFLKELVRTTGRRLFCKQHNPKREIEFDRGEVHRLWRVLTLRDLLG